MTPIAERPRQHRSGPVPDHSVARGGAGAFRGCAVSARGAERDAAARRRARLRAGAKTWWRRSTCRRSTVPMSTALRCVPPISPPPAKRTPVRADAERRGDRLRHRAEAAGAVGHRDVDRDRRAGAARRRRRRHGRAHPARGQSRDRDPPRRLARAIRLLCRLRHRARRSAAARRHHHRLARDRHAGGLRHRRSRRRAPAARRHDLDRRRTGAAGRPAASRRDLRHQRRDRHRGDRRERRRGGISRRHSR